MLTQQRISKYQKLYPFLDNTLNLKPSLWINSKLTKFNQIQFLPLDKEDMLKAEELWNRFMPFFKKEFPELEKTNGIIESPLKRLSGMNEELAEQLGINTVENIYL
ncbi:hypothetical protein SNE36_07345 [Virgibacillus tibetensis]